jgi:hypothetical protein
VSLKALAHAVLARDTGRDRQRDTPAATCPTYVARCAPGAGHSASLPPIPTSAALATPLDLPGMPRPWAEGVALLQTISAPSGIAPVRWARFQDDARRLLANEHGAELQAGVAGDLNRVEWINSDVWYPPSHSRSRPRAVLAVGNKLAFFGPA